MFAGAKCECQVPHKDVFIGRRALTCYHYHVVPLTRLSRYWFARDLAGRPTLIVRAARHDPNASSAEESVRFALYIFEKGLVDLAITDQVTVLLDFNDAAPYYLCEHFTLRCAAHSPIRSRRRATPEQPLHISWFVRKTVLDAG